jgi:hypothetical protein
MEVVIGNVFRNNYSTDNYKSYIDFKVVEIIDFTRAGCEVYLTGCRIGYSIEHKNTLLKMKKLSSLEKELL